MKSRNVAEVVMSLMGLITIVACSGGSSSLGGHKSSISDKQDVIDAVVRIEASGSYRDFTEGQQASDWSGTGFLISADGLIVTNQHVVEGAGSLDVYLNNEDRPKNARILGVSECNDLAVIDLDGDGYTFLDWYRDTPEPGLDVWVAGFPLGDPEYTLTRGSITKAEASGEMVWASLDYTLEHDARQEPGNSGGPLVTDKGRVVGINFAGGDIGGTGVEHFYSIPTTLALPVIDILTTGKDQDSLGINGITFYDEASQVSGLWVSGVRAGSPASQVGLLPGDVVTDLAGRPVVTASDLDRDGFASKAGYCDVLRTQGSDRAMSISVLRIDTGELLEGEVNNPDKPLTVKQTISSEVTGDANVASSSDFTYELVTDDSGRVEVELPTQWMQRDGGEVDILNGKWPGIVASPDLQGFYDRWDIPGIAVIAASGLTDQDIASTLDYLTLEECTFDSRNEYETRDMKGQYDFYYNCGGPNGSIAVIGAFYDSYYNVVVAVIALAVVESDLAVIDHALETVYLP